MRVSMSKTILNQTERLWCLSVLSCRLTDPSVQEIKA